jgi:hypothetical protein
MARVWPAVAILALTGAGLLVAAARESVRAPWFRAAGGLALAVAAAVALVPWLQERAAGAAAVAMGAVCLLVAVATLLAQRAARGGGDR